VWFLCLLTGTIAEIYEQAHGVTLEGIRPPRFMIVTAKQLYPKFGSTPCESRRYPDPV
jgi:hypothetical protein